MRTLREYGWFQAQSLLWVLLQSATTTVSPIHVDARWVCVCVYARARVHVSVFKYGIVPCPFKMYVNIVRLYT